MKKIYKTSILIGLLGVITANGAVFSSNSSYAVCFTPGQDCQQLVVDQVNTAHQSIDVQAYHITNKAIIVALKTAKSRGVKVRLIVDKQGVKEAQKFFNGAIPVWVDYKPAIAHNKIMIIDNITTLGGSFNWTESAQKRNAENLTAITDKIYTTTFENNFLSRLQASRTLQPIKLNY